MKKIYAVETKAGIITRVSENTYAYAVVDPRNGGVYSWHSRYDLARRSASDTGLEIMPCTILDKMPRDPHPEIRIWECKHMVSEKGRRYGKWVEMDGIAYVNHIGDTWETPTEADSKCKELKGYLDKVYGAYRFLKGIGKVE